MNRARLLVLSGLALAASGAMVFACSDNGGGNDAGPDSGGSDAKADANGGKDSTTSDVSTSDATSDATNDVTNDVSTEDASDSGSTDATASDADAGASLTFMVLRAGGSVDAGTDAAIPSGVSQPVFLEERNVSDGSLVRTLALPTTASGSNQPLTISGTATSEGSLSTSPDGRFVIVAGYAAAPGLASVATTSTDGGALRVIARVDSVGNVDTSTELASFDQNNIRGAATDDGGSFWAVGSAAADAGLGGGVQYVMLSSTGASSGIDGVPANTRVVAVFGGQLYVSTAFTPYNGVFAVGTGEPTTPGQTSALLAGFAGDAGSPYGFSMLDLDGSVSGLDTLYVADDSVQTSGGGIQKWVFDGTKWTKIATFTNGTTKGFRGVTAFPSSNGVVVIGTSSDSSANMIIKYLDDGVNTNPNGTVLATATTGTIFRGITAAPH